MADTTKLKALIDFLRSEGVSSYEEDGIRITLTSKPVPDPQEKAAPREQARRDKLYGLTREEQVDLFNEVVSEVG